MVNDLPTIENQQDLVEMLTRRIESFLTAYNKANTVGRLHCTAETVAPPHHRRATRSGASTDRGALPGADDPH